MTSSPERHSSVVVEERVAEGGGGEKVIIETDTSRGISLLRSFGERQERRPLAGRSTGGSPVPPNQLAPHEFESGGAAAALHR